MISIGELRRSVQGPRRAVDSWYGRYVMRRFSVYLTWICLRFRLSPNGVTFISLLVGVVGGLLLAGGLFGWGIVLINLWYLLDHVDGELARSLGRMSQTGLYFDTLTNFFVQPMTFLGLGWGLSSHRYDGLFLSGLLGAFGCLMLMIVPLLEENLVYREWIKRKSAKDWNSVRGSSLQESSPHILKRVFMLLHKFILFSTFLAVLSIGYVVVCFQTILPRVFWLKGVLVVYVAVCTFVWATHCVHKLITHHPDRLSA